MHAFATFPASQGVAPVGRNRPISLFDTARTRPRHAFVSIQSKGTNSDQSTSTVTVADRDESDPKQQAASAQQYLEQQAMLQSLNEALPSSKEQEQSDTSRAAVVAAAVIALALATETNKEWISAHQELMMALVFGAGYTGIIVEDLLGLNKSGIALLMAAALWSIRADASPEVVAEASESLADVSEVIFFLIGAMTIVETVDNHQGFKLLSDTLKPTNRTTLLWSVGWIAFFMSAVLDNLTTTIVMVSLLQKLCPEADTRKLLGAVIVIAANAGGAWTPIGDVTTTMLWVGGQMSTVATLQDLFLPSAVSLVVPLALMTALEPGVKGEMVMPPKDASQTEAKVAPRGGLVMALGLACLLGVPVFRTVTGLPPYMGMLAGLGFLWVFVDAIHFGEDKKRLAVSAALKKIDSESVLFFLGILMAVGALASAGLLKQIAGQVDQLVGGSQELVALTIGGASAVLDNVPLVAATMGMYDINQYPTDNPLWQMIAYAAGTGGSMLVIGSAPGVAFMGLEHVGFGWYLRKVTPWAVAGYLAGFATYTATHGGFSGL